MAGKRARVGVIGAGWWSTFAHLPSLSTYPEAELIGLADANPDKAAQAAERFGVPRSFTDHRELLALNPNVVLIATPHDTHYQLAKDALLAGADVMIEKPMVVDPTHGRELVAIARERGLALHVGYPYPYMRHSRLLRDLIESGELGDILFVSSLFATSVLSFYRGDTAYAGVPEAGAMWAPGTSTYSDPAHGGGQMLTQVTHSSSLLFFLTGVRPADVHAFADNHDTKVDVWDAVNFRTGSGACGSVASTGTVAVTQKVMEEYRIFGSKGHAALDTSKGTLEIFFNDGTVRKETPLAENEFYPMHLTSRQLVDTYLGKSPVHVSGDLGLLTVEFLAAALESARTGQVVHLPAEG
jgi:predicted dehydrogenase